MDCEVLIIGAGPTGLVLALWLDKLGIDVRIIDRLAEPGTTSRALAVQARTLELYRQLDLADAVIERGHKVAAVNLWVLGERRARVPFTAIGENLTPYPFAHVYPQDEHERLLIERLHDARIEVERRTEAVDFTDHGDAIEANLRRASGEALRCRAAYIVGCDGAHSIVRHVIGAGFPGGTYRQVFYVADVDAAGGPMNGELNIDLDEADFLAVFPLGAEHARLVGTVRDERADRAETLRFEDVSDRAIRNLKLEVRAVNWFSTYRVHHRVTDRFRKGRAFLAGDAAHIHSPAGGQGMNTGIGDAINLAWKIAAVLRGRAHDALLDTYEEERIRFARRLVRTTDRIFTFATADGPIANVVRTRFAPIVLSKLVEVRAFREFMFRTVSQIGVSYRGLSLNDGTAGAVHGGDRLPWAPFGEDNLPSAMTWQVHVYGDATPALRHWCDEHGIPLQVFPWRDEHGKIGLARDAAYIIRPDAYVGLACTAPTAESIERYFRDRHIRRMT